MKSDTSASRVPFYDYAALGRERGAEVMAAVESVINRGAFIMQAEVDQFEAALADYLGVGDVVGVGNCTDGLELILRAAGVGAGDEVIVPAHTFVASAGAVIAVGATPRLAEVGADRALDLAELDRLATDRTRAVMPVSLNGRCADLDVIVERATERGWIVVEDAAQAIGARLHGRPAGTFGLAGAFSFYPAKTLGASGDSGGIVTTDTALAAQLRSMRDHGRNATGDVLFWGRNSRLDNLQAAVLLVQMTHYEADTNRRREIFARYLTELADVPGLGLPTFDDGDRFDVAQNFEISVGDRDALREALSSRGVGTSLPWGGKAITDFDGLKIDDATPRTSALLASLVLLPLHQYLTDESVDTVIAAVREVCS
jgi:dTDP-4-amino-4,6-dideoxygalactose transaminase